MRVRHTTLLLLTALTVLLNAPLDGGEPGRARAGGARR